MPITAIIDVIGFNSPNMFCHFPYSDTFFSLSVFYSVVCTAGFISFLIIYYNCFHFFWHFKKLN